MSDNGAHFAAGYGVRSRCQVDPFEIWCAHAKDVIVGKLMTWAEGRSRRHETDIYEMMVFHYLGVDPTSSVDLEAHVDAQAAALGRDVVELWQAVKDAASQEAGQARL